MVLKVQRRIEIAQVFGVAETRNYTIKNQVLRAQGDALLAARQIYVFIREAGGAGFDLTLRTLYSLDDGTVFIDRGTETAIAGGATFFTTIAAIGTDTRIQIFASVGGTVDVSVHAV